MLKIILPFLFLLISGCASFHQQEIAQVTQLPDVSSYQHKPSVFIDFNFYRGDPGNKSAPIGKVTENLKPVIGQAVDKSKLFSHFSFNDSEKSQQDYTIKIDVYNHGNYGLAAASGFISGITLGVIPGLATDNYTMDLKALNHSGAELASVTNKDSVDTWIGLWFIPMMNNTPNKAVASSLENQLISALKDLFEKGVLKYSFIPYSKIEGSVL